MEVEYKPMQLITTLVKSNQQKQKNRLICALMDRCCVWASKPGELNDGSSPRPPHATRPNNEPQGSLRTIRKNPSLVPKNEGTLPQGFSIRHKNEEVGPQSHLPGT